MAEVRELTLEELRILQLLELDMLKEFDRVCRKYNINYVIICGTLLGAVRHKGFIPWDDDADIGMLREDYEKFRQVSHELNKNICYFQDHKNDPEYLWEYSKLRRTGTSYVRAGQEHIKGKTGVFIDIFPMDAVPNSVPLQMIQDFKCFFLRKVLYARVGKISAKNFISRGIYKLLSVIPVEFVYKRIDVMTKKETLKAKRVRVLLFPAFGKLYYKQPLKERYGILRSWLSDRSEYEFEEEILYGPKDYDGFLKYMYRDYMKLPPENKRYQHSPVSSLSIDVESESVKKFRK